MNSHQAVLSSVSREFPILRYVARQEFRRNLSFKAVTTIITRLRFIRWSPREIDLIRWQMYPDSFAQATCSCCCQCTNGDCCSSRPFWERDYLSIQARPTFSKHPADHEVALRPQQDIYVDVLPVHSFIPVGENK